MADTVRRLADEHRIGETERYWLSARKDLQFLPMPSSCDTVMCGDCKGSILYLRPDIGNLWSI